MISFETATVQACWPAAVNAIYSSFSIVLAQIEDMASAIAVSSALVDGLAC